MEIFERLPLQYLDTVDFSRGCCRCLASRTFPQEWSLNSILQRLLTDLFLGNWRIDHVQTDMAWSANWVFTWHRCSSYSWIYSVDAPWVSTCVSKLNWNDSWCDCLFFQVITSQSQTTYCQVFYVPQLSDNLLLHSTCFSWCQDLSGCATYKELIQKVSNTFLCTVSRFFQEALWLFNSNSEPRAIWPYWLMFSLPLLSKAL